VAAREDFAKKSVPLEYFDVTKDPDGMKRMLEFSDGKRVVPVIVEGEKVTIGWGGT
jgi:glutaredoxin